MNLDCAAVLSATGGRVIRLSPGEPVPAAGTSTPLHVADLEASFSGVSVDSRSVSPGSLFVALPGERTDGHAHVGSAFAAGATGAIVSRLPNPEEMPSDRIRYLFLVDSPLTAVQDLARTWRHAHSAAVVGITGSIGKTTTKEISAQVLSVHGPVLKSLANFNTEIGLPLTLMNLRSNHWAAVVEMGMHAPGDIALLASIAQPDVGIVTNVAPIHLERMGTIEAIARAKSELVAALSPNALAVLNGDDVWTRAMAVTSGVAGVVLVGQSADCDYRAVDVRPHGLDGVAFTIEAEGLHTPFRSPIPGSHTVGAVSIAVAVGRHLGMTWAELQDAVGAAQLDERQRIIRTDRRLIIDDSYNAAPMSVRAALELLREAPGTKIAVLGDMLELGPLEEAGHREVGRSAAAAADWLVTRGPRSRWIADEAARAGMPGDHVRQVPGNVEAAETVREIVAAEAGDEPIAILVKGSRGMNMEEVVLELTGGTH